MTKDRTKINLKPEAFILVSNMKKIRSSRMGRYDHKEWKDMVQQDGEDMIAITGKIWSSRMGKTWPQEPGQLVIV